MTRTIIATDRAPGAIGPYSQAVSAGGFLFLSGQIPLDPRSMEIMGSSAAEQAEAVLENLSRVLEAGGSSCRRVVKVTVYLKDLGDFAAVNEVYARYFGEESPARACVEVSRLPKDVLVEIDAVALCD